MRENLAARKYLRIQYVVLMPIDPIIDRVHKANLWLS